tara:strand:+ start:72 stop:341 length:270 start_codon:yes stop_codon:yes gene_type:complete
MFKYIAIAAMGVVSTEAMKIQVNTLNQVITELDILEKHKLNSELEVELLDFLQQEMEAGSLTKMKEQNQSILLGDTTMWIKKRFTNRPY